MKSFTLYGWDECGSGSDECTRTKTLASPHLSRKETWSGGMKAGQDDALSLDCQDDDLLKETEQHLDNKENTSDKVADSMAEMINKRFD